MAFLVGSSWGLTALCPQWSTHNGNGMRGLGNHPPSAFWPQNWHSRCLTYEKLTEESLNTHHRANQNILTVIKRKIKKIVNVWLWGVAHHFTWYYFAATPACLLNNWRRKESNSNHLHKKTSCPDRNQKRFTAKSVCTCTWCCVT